MEIKQLISLIIFSVMMTYTPGPSNLLLMGTAMQSGFKKTIPMLLGVVFGFLLVAISVTSGLGKVFVLYPISLQIIKILGSIYLLYLSYKIFQSRNLEVKANNENKPSFKKGALIHPLSPKAWVMVATAYSQFINTQGNIFTQSFIIILALVVAGSSSNCLWMAAGSYLQRHLQNKKIVYWTFTLLSISLVVLIISMWF